MSEKKFLYWMAVSESEAVYFSELAHLMAKAQYPTDAELDQYAITRLTLEDELPRAVRNGELFVRNPAGMGRLEYTDGAVLQSAVMLPRDLGPFLAERGIELRLNPHGSGPAYWTIENAAAAIAEQEQWHGGTLASFQDQLLEAAQRGEIDVLDPQTCLSIKAPQPRTFWELVRPDDVNAWLEKQGAPYRWDAATPEATPEPQAATPAPTAPNYAMLATPDQLIAAFGSMSGMNSGWFRSMKDRPALKEAVVITGVKGRHGAPPMLDVFKVLQYLLSPKRQGRTLQPETGWRLLKGHFPKVYAAHEACDPNATD